jgi:hypothetical protein
MADTPDDDAMLDRKAVAAALTAAGYPISAQRLTDLGYRKGPPYQHWGPRCIYRWADALTWAKGRGRDPRMHACSRPEPSVAEPVTT